MNTTLGVSTVLMAGAMIGYGNYFGKEKVDENAAIAALQLEMLDPNTLQFRNIRRGNDPYVICGEVNAKNHFGGYVGFTPFLYDGKSKILVVADQRPTQVENETQKLLQEVRLDAITNLCTKLT